MSGIAPLRRIMAAGGGFDTKAHQCQARANPDNKGAVIPTRRCAFPSPAQPRGMPVAVDPDRVNRTIGCTAPGLPFARLGTAVFSASPAMFSISHWYCTRIRGGIQAGAPNGIGANMNFFFRCKARDAAGNPAHALRNVLLARLAGWVALGVAYFPSGGWGQYPERTPGPTSRFFLADTRPIRRCTPRPHGYRDAPVMLSATRCGPGASPQHGGAASLRA